MLNRAPKSFMIAASQYKRLMEEREMIPRTQKRALFLIASHTKKAGQVSQDVTLFNPLDLQHRFSDCLKGNSRPILLLMLCLIETSRLLVFSLAFLALPPLTTNADTVVRDTFTQPIDTRVGAESQMSSLRHNHFFGSPFSKFTGFGFVGNGLNLSKVEFAIQYRDSATGGGLNQGPIGALQWQAALFLDGTKFHGGAVFNPWEPAAENGESPQSPDYHAMVSPSSTDWNSSIGTHVSPNSPAHGLNTYKIEFDFSALGWQTVANQVSTIVITPVNLDNGRYIRTYIPQSNYRGESLGFQDYVHWPGMDWTMYTLSRGPQDPDFIYKYRQYELGYRYNWEDVYDGRYAAVRISTSSVPEPSSIFLLLFGGIGFSNHMRKRPKRAV